MYTKVSTRCSVSSVLSVLGAFGDMFWIVYEQKVLNELLITKKCMRNVLKKRFFNTSCF